MQETVAAGAPSNSPMKKPSGSAAAKQAASAKPGFQPSAAAQPTANATSSGRIGRMLKSFMAGDRADGLMTDITAGDAMAVPPKQAGPNSEPGYFQVGMVRMPGADEALGSPSLIQPGKAAAIP